MKKISETLTHMWEEHFGWLCVAVWITTAFITWAALTVMYG